MMAAIRHIHWLIVIAVFAPVALGQQRSPGDPAAEPQPPARIEAEPAEPTPPQPQTWWEQWQQIKQEIEDRFGTTVSLNIDIVGRSALAGPESDIQKMILRYDLLLRQRVTDDSLLSMDVRGGWGEGVIRRLDIFANTNQFFEDEDIFILHLYYQHQFIDEQLTLRVGKFDIGDWLDTNRYGYYNFLGYSFAHNSTIPLTGNTLGVMASYEPTDAGWYIAGGTSNATQTPIESGLRSTFKGDSEWMTIGEFGIKPTIADRKGVYRFIAWHSSRPFETSGGSTKRDAIGAAISFDQDLTDRLGAFFRFGVVDGDPFEPKRYYSAGLHLTEPIAGRTEDTLAIGVVINEFTAERTRSIDDGRDAETYLELYYNYQVTEWMQLQPVFQVVFNPGGRDDDTAIIAGLHLALRF